MKLGIPSVDEKVLVRELVTHKTSFIGNIISSNAPVSTATEWVSGGTYAISDIVKVDALKTEYICLVTNSTAYPPDSDEWEPNTQNEYRFRDSIPTTKTVITTGDFEVIVDMYSMNYLAGEFINNAGHAKLYKIDDALVSENVDPTSIPNGELVDETEMTLVVDFECFNCCNPEPIRKRDFGFDLSDVECGDMYYKLVVSQFDTAIPLEIGTITPLKAYPFGCVKIGTKYKVDKNFEFTQTKLLKNIEVVRWGSTATLDGTLYMPTIDRDRNIFLTTHHNGFVFGILDDLDSIDVPFVDIVMGDWTDDGFPYSKNKEIEVNFKIQGVLA